MITADPITTPGVVAHAAARISEVVVDADRPRSIVLGLLARGSGTVSMDVQAIEGAVAIGAVRRGIERGGTVAMLTSPAVGAATFADRYGLGDAERAGRLLLRDYEAMALGQAEGAWQHSKLITYEGVDGAEAWFTNVAPKDSRSGIIDVAVRLEDETARAAIRVARAWRSGDFDELRMATADAAGAGLLLNDAALHQHSMSQALDRGLAGARQRVLFVTKGLDDERTARALADQVASGTAVAAVIGYLAEPSARILRDGQVPVAIARRTFPSRINLFATDDSSLLATGYPTSGILWPGPDGATIGRESALLLDGSNAERVLARVAGTPEGELALRLADGEPTERAVARFGALFTPLRAATLGDGLVERVH